MNKKGLFFTAMSVLFLVALVFASTTNFTATEHYRSDVIQNRVITMNAIVQEIETIYIDAIVINATKTVLNRIPKQTSQTDFETLFQLEITAELNREFTVMRDLVQEVHGIDTTFSIDSIQLTQEKPFSLNLSYDFTFAVAEYDLSTKQKRQDSLAQWVVVLNKTSTNISLHGVKNPLTGHTMNTTRTTVLSSAIRDHVVFAATTTPSYLDRMYGSLTSSSRCCGIWMLVDTAFINQQHSSDPSSIPDKGCLSQVDFMIFRNFNGLNVKDYTVDSTSISLHVSSSYGNPTNTFSLDTSSPTICP